MAVAPLVDPEADTTTAPGHAAASVTVMTIVTPMPVMTPMPVVTPMPLVTLVAVITVMAMVAMVAVTPLSRTIRRKVYQQRRHSKKSRKNHLFHDKYSVLFFFRVFCRYRLLIR